MSIALGMLLPDQRVAGGGVQRVNVIGTHRSQVNPFAAQGWLPIWNLNGALYGAAVGLKKRPCFITGTRRVKLPHRADGAINQFVVGG